MLQKGPYLSLGHNLREGGGEGGVGVPVDEIDLALQERKGVPSREVETEMVEC